MAFHTNDYFPSSVPNFAPASVPGGTVDGMNATFTLAHAPNPALSLMLFVNGAEQAQGAIAPYNDYTLSGSTITFLYPPPQGSVILAWYMY